MVTERTVRVLLLGIALSLLSSLIGDAQKSQPKLMIFGDKDHKTYLGCLNCARSAADSIFNKGGPYGHCPGSFSDNLFCRGPFRDFGSSGPFQDLSACGTNASNPPVIVDGDGKYYGRFSIGGPFGHSDSVCSEIFGDFRSKDVCAIVKWVCAQ
jgi:hypothetical protein